MQFLSTDWLAAADEALRTHDGFQAEAATAWFRFWIVPEKAPAWANPATVAIDNGTVSAAAGTAGNADAVAHATYANWIAMLEGRLDPKRAGLTRRVRGTGLSAVLANLTLLDCMLDALREVPFDE